MNQQDNIEARETGPASQDRTSTAWFNDTSEQEAEQQRQLFAACAAIRKMHINVSNVRQLLSTIAATAKANGWTDAMVYPLDNAQEELDE
jgi:hemoglobin-like flavoprotein